MLTFQQKNKLATNGDWRNLIMAHLMRVASLATFERPADIEFGSAHADIVATGQLAKAQRRAHELRHTRAISIMNSPRQFVETAALNMACNVVEELARRGKVDEAGAVTAICSKIAAGEEVASQEWAILEQVVYAVMDHAFSAVSGFNAHAWTPPEAE